VEALARNKAEEEAALKRKQAEEVEALARKKAEEEAALKSKQAALLHLLHLLQVARSASAL